MRTNIREVFANMARAARWAGINTTGLSLQEGNSTDGVAYRLYVLTPPSAGHNEWPYSPPGGFLGKTRGEAIKTLDTMRYVFQGIALAKDEQERRAQQ